MANDADNALSPALQCKTCTKCGEEKPIDGFPRDKGRPDGRFPHCKECNKSRALKWYADNPEKGKAKAKKQRLENPEKTKLYLAQWYVENKEYASQKRKSVYDANPEAVIIRIKEWAAANPDKVRNRSAKRRLDPKFRLENAIRVAVSSGIRRGTKSSSTFDILGYTPDELRAHLEAKFTDGMSWENYGRGGWHVDHVFPLASFTFDTPECPDFKKAFALKNLQPLWEPENCSKRARLDHPSQVAILAAI
jgi:hypothetical protein